MPAEGAEQLEAIGETARDAMTEMRRVLGVLRTGDGGELAPQPGLDRLGELLETARAAGTPVRLVLEGAVAPLSPGVELTAYRVVQEALTNARRHAPGAAVEVELRYDDDALGCACATTGPGSGAGARATGCSGMRERVTMVGGELRDRPADGGGFLVEARLPRVIRVVVVDDQQIVRAGFAALLDTQPDIDGRRHRGRRRARRSTCARRSARRRADGRPHAGDGRHRGDAAARAAPRVLVLTTFDLDEYVYDALSAGASGFLLKDVPAEQLFDAVRVIAAGEALLAPSVTRRLIDEFARQRPRPRRSR